MIAAICTLLPVLAPLLVAALLGAGPRFAGPARAVAPWLPLTLVAALLADGPVALPAALLEAGLGVDAVAAPLVVLTTLAWTAAGWFARDRVDRDPVLFWSGWLVSLSGISLALLARDLAGLYAGYAVLSLASWLLIVHARTAGARRAGRVYLVLTLAGEMAVFSGVIAIASAHGNIELSELSGVPLAEGWRWLVIAGFAVKMGIVPLHLWLPLAHPVAPVPASAILSGVIVKAGLLGWLRLVPPGGPATELLGPALLAIGVATAFLGVGAGLTQRRIKVVLAYSTISQMGLVLAAYGALLLAPGENRALLPWLGVLVLHHGLNKAALFLACGCAPGRTRFRAALLALPALALAAAPLTTGALAKAGIKTALVAAGTAHAWTMALSLSSAATTLLVWHFWRLARGERDNVRIHPAWPALVAAGLAVPWLWARMHSLDAHLTGSLWSATWPLMLAAAVLGLKRRVAPRWRLQMPAGDLVVPLERIVAAIGRGGARPWSASAGGPPNLYPVHLRVTATLLWLERKMTALPVAGVLILAVGGLLWLIGHLTR